MTIEFFWNGQRYEHQRPDAAAPPQHIRLLAKHPLGPSMWLDLEFVTRNEKRGVERYRVANVSKQERSEVA